MDEGRGSAGGLTGIMTGCWGCSDIDASNITDNPFGSPTGDAIHDGDGATPPEIV
jgi:hypothetical protein